MALRSFLMLLLLPFPVLAQDKLKTLEANLRQLEKEIAQVRGLNFKNPVVAKIISRTKDDPPGTQGFYSLKEKTLYVFDDVPGNYERGVLIHEIVHALQDQHFGLAKLHQAEFGSDRELALAALIEGDASYTMIEVLKKEQPKAALMMEVPLEKAKNLRNAFLYGQGARYVKALKDKGGWEAVNARYKFPPRSTSQILQPGLSSIDLGPGQVVGAFGLIQKLGDDPAARALAAACACGLLADRIVEDGAVKTWQLAFDQPGQGERFRQAHNLLMKSRHADALERGGLWHLPNGRRIGVLAKDARVAVIDAPSEAAFRAAWDRLEGLPSLLIWSARERRQITFGELLDRLLEADAIAIGENHDSELCHRLQLHLIKALYAADDRLAVGFEMFQRPFQHVLDQFAAGAINEETFLQDSEYQKRWGFHWSLYRPIVLFCQRNGIPLAALNVPMELTRRLSKVGYAALTDQEKKDLGAIDFNVKIHRDHWYERLAQMHGRKDTPEDQKERSYQVMTAWDDFMADSGAAFQTSRNIRRLVVLAGIGHIEHGFGIPRRLEQRTGGRVLTVNLAVGGDAEKLTSNPTTDFVILPR